MAYTRYSYAVARKNGGHMVSAEHEPISMGAGAKRLMRGPRELSRLKLKAFFTFASAK